MNKKKEELTLSRTSKMPCHSYNIPASMCITGSKLAVKSNTVCSHCYAKRFRYNWGNVKAAMIKRSQEITHKNWVELMVIALTQKEKSGYFRWHDSGDLQSLNHLKNIVEIAKRLPKIKFYLPTKEYGILGKFLKDNRLPDNLIVRLSEHLLNTTCKSHLVNLYSLQTSSVDSGVGFSCPAEKQGNKCLNCRACWNKKIKNVDYKKS
jgi:hypothetical protein